MATVTRTIGIIPWDGVTVATVELDYDNADMRVRTIRVVNPAPRALVIETARGDRSRIYNQTCPTGTTEITVATNPPNRLQLNLDARGRLDGLDWQVFWAEV